MERQWLPKDLRTKGMHPLGGLTPWAHMEEEECLWHLKVGDLLLPGLAQGTFTHWRILLPYRRTSIAEKQQTISGADNISIPIMWHSNPWVPRTLMRNTMQKILTVSKWLDSSIVSHNCRVKPVPQWYYSPSLFHSPVPRIPVLKWLRTMLSRTQKVSVIFRNHFCQVIK